jgi:1-phosphofructokinase family hexose kinase
MILTVTLNPAIDKVLILNRFEIHKLHRLKSDEISMTIPGGKGVNIALTLQLLGNKCIATGFAGGHPGHMLCDRLRQKGITTSFLFTEDDTRTNTSILDQEHETLTEINDSGQEISNDEFDFFIENYERLLHRADFVVIAGSLPKGLPEDAYRIMIEMAKERGLKVIIHTSPKYMNPIVDSAPFLINPDMRSNHSFMGKPLDGIEHFLKAGKEIIKANKDTEFVLFTHRLENVVAVTRCKSYIIRPQNLKIVNMLGYADAYLSGFIHAYRKNLSIPEILRFASSAGLANVETLYKEISDNTTIFKDLNRIDIEEV